MKQKKQTEKKLSLKKLQMVKINNPQTIKGGNGVNDYNGDDTTGTGTGRTR
ncbi:hypothetical protein [Chryseobacterium sp. YR221]|uniref:hypothetical protein n=1 Tax=Chryseobacterium sp. YR221 TaxID=1500293 RepID=UPI0009D8CA5F|nr:hypothetical protein [Chryseobacterium sp. YR221]CAH0173282.1 hypothetical protein SRABI04_01313 [Chryseobacterium sp. Bi04]SMC31363.1 hypothetical protein SAMN02787074_0167 [Chryseobacterium sp. YR221]